MRTNERDFFQTRKATTKDREDFSKLLRAVRNFINIQQVRPTVTHTALREMCFSRTRDQLRVSLSLDLLAVQAMSAVDDLTKITNLLSKRMREWADASHPELVRKISDNEQLVAIFADGARRDETGVGAPLAAADDESLRLFAKTVLALFEERRRLLAYIEGILKELMPNAREICGTPVAAGLLVAAGSFARLSQLPSSTIQLLGAETALFRHLKNKKHRPPKHGLIFNHPLLQSSRKELRGKVARTLADKITIALKVDRFKGEPCGERMRQELERRFAV